MMEGSEEQSLSSLSSEQSQPHSTATSSSSTTISMKTKKSKNKERKENNVLDVKTLSEWSSNDESRFKSHFFHLQLTELLREMQINYNLLEKSFQSWLSRVKQCWNSLSERVIRSSDYMTKYSAPRLHNTDLTFVFHKPVRITVIGSYTTRTLLKSRLNIDIAVLLPAVRRLSFLFSFFFSLSLCRSSCYVSQHFMTNKMLLFLSCLTSLVLCFFDDRSPAKCS
jgi:hypothetical protein